MKDVLTFEVDHSTRNLVIALPGQTEICDYQLEILSRNLHPGILPVEKRINNQIIKLYYRIEDKIPLVAYLDLKMPERDHLLIIIENLTGIILDSRNYLLYPAGFLLDMEYIYLNPRNMDVSLVYLPINEQADLAEKFRSLMKEILQLSQIKNNLKSESEKILECINSDPIYLMELRILCREQRYNLSRQVSELKPFKLAESNFPLEAGKVSGLEPVCKQERRTRSIKSIIVFGVLQTIYVLALVLATPLLARLKDAAALYLAIGVILVFLNIVILRKLFSRDSNKKSAP